jgi:hypothetical protein
MTPGAASCGVITGFGTRVRRPEGNGGEHKEKEKDDACFSMTSPDTVLVVHASTPPGYDFFPAHRPTYVFSSHLIWYYLIVMMHIVLVIHRTVASSSGLFRDKLVTSSTGIYFLLCLIDFFHRILAEGVSNCQDALLTSNSHTPPRHRRREGDRIRGLPDGVLRVFSSNLLNFFYFPPHFAQISPTQIP